MDKRIDLSRFDGQTKLLLKSVMSGVRNALCVFHRLQRSNPVSVHKFLEALCREEIFTEDVVAQPLVARPLVCLLPRTFQQNLLSFIHLVHPALPQTSVIHLLDCLSQEPGPSPWINALVRQLQRDLGDARGEPLHTPLCSQRLTGLLAHLVGPGQVGGWITCLSGEKVELSPRTGPEIPGEGTPQRKRKSSCVTLDSDPEEIGQQTKRIKMDQGPAEDVYRGDGFTGVNQVPREDTLVKIADVSSISSAGPELPTGAAADSVCDSLPEHIKACIPQIKELLECQEEWDQSSTDTFRVLNECDPTQVEVLCSILHLSDTLEQNLPQLCSSILACSDLSHSTAVTLIKNLLLGKVLSLSEPASRCLVTAVTSLCSRYPRPTIHALIGPVLEQSNIENSQAELLIRLIETCLEPQFRLLVLPMICKGVWNEAGITVIHCLLDSKLELNDEQFTEFIDQLVSQAPQFTKSMKYAKMMLTVLTKYCSHVTGAHKHSLQGCLVSNETFLKKALQAALKKITDT